MLNSIRIFTEQERQEKGKGFSYKGKEFIHHSDLHPSQTAFKRLSFSQAGFIFIFLLMLVGLFFWNWHITLLGIVTALTVLYFGDLLFNLYLIYRSFTKSAEIQISQDAIDAVSEASLPTYTVFCPLYNEWKVVPQFIEAMKKLDYPKEKLQIMLLLEASDTETITQIQAFELPEYFEIAVVPHSLPKTKPKALNYGLQRAKGEYIVIYDAEDIPDPLQLKKVILAYTQLDVKTICIQAKLNFYNPQQNTLTRVFTAEYSLWFDLVLTGLQSISAPIPLGGTSNHFKTSALHELQGWDSFNVTEDADLGMRLAKKGYKTAIVDSVTLEEANSDFGNWFSQRTRWIKGYIQTYLVHMRRPGEFLHSWSEPHLLTFQFIIGGKVLSMMINPFMWAITIIYFGFRMHVGTFIESFFPGPILYMGVFSLAVGNFLYMYYYMIGCIKHGHHELVKYVFLVPFYWLCMSAAAWVAFYKLIAAPHYWSKTNHGLHLSVKTPQQNKEEYTVKHPVLSHIKNFCNKYMGFLVFIVSTEISAATLVFYAMKGYILAYGDAESHINISKRVIDGLTPGFGQLGGVWLPLQHVLMIPFVTNDFLWRSGIGGSIVSMICFVISSVFIYKIIKLLTKNSFAGLLGSFVFFTNPNMLYLQSTPLGEVSLIVMLIITMYFLLKWIKTDNFMYLALSGVFICLGSLIRYDAWFFIFCCIGVIPFIALCKKYRIAKIESSVIAYSTVAFLGMLFWLLWNFLIFKNPFYFFESPYSAKAQQLSWLHQGMLPSYHNIVSSIIFYTHDAIANVGDIFFILALVSLILFFFISLKSREKFSQYLGLLLITSPYLFYVITLFVGVSIIFMPGLVPKSFQSQLFNVRYGIMMLPAVAIFIGIIFGKVNTFGKLLIGGLIVYQLFLFFRAGTPITLQDGLTGLSARRPNPANGYVATHYDYGYIMFDDYSRTANPVSLNIPMNKIIYVGNHPYWENALKNPTKYVRWFIIRQDDNDVLWKNFRYNKTFSKEYHVVYHEEKIFVYKRTTI